MPCNSGEKMVRNEAEKLQKNGTQAWLGSGRAKKLQQELGDVTTMGFKTREG